MEGVLWGLELWKRGSGEVFQGEELADEGGPDRLLEDN